MIFTVVLMFLMVATVGALLVITPWLMPATECLTVSVPHGARNEEPLRTVMRSYAYRTGAASVLSLLAWPAAFVLGHIDLNTEVGMQQFTILMTATMFVPIIASFALMLHYRGRVRAIKQEQGWSSAHPQAAAFVGPEDFPQPLSLMWNLAYLPLVAGMVAFALANYDRFPAQIPMNIDFSGNVAAYEPKRMGTVLFPAIVAAFMGIVFSGTHWGIIRSKKPIDPSAPASSALAYAQFARMQSIIQLVGGLGISALTGVTFYASSLGVLPLSTAAPIMLVGTFAYVVVMLVFSTAMGQSGARIAAEPAAGGFGTDDDAHWLLGTIYVNRQDPSIFVPKRFGIGWTCNMGRWESWALVAALVAVTVLFVLLTTSFAS